MTTTPKLGLNKPVYEDFADVEKLNENFDKLDNAMVGEIQPLTIDTENWNDFTLEGSDYTVKKMITIDGITASDVVFINYTIATKAIAAEANASHVESVDGGIEIYAESIPTGPLNATLLVQKG
ncbi:hypothetical protein [Bacteroides heparinolyticus]|uniref:hypothetical protein n=1 Tax=Prevotella heparinolytica TaxID=28113 RepID=UPI0035A0F3FA